MSNSNIHVYCKTLTETIPKYPYNLWNGRNFLFKKKALFPEKLSDFGGKILQATSFKLAPFNYQNDDGSRGGWEYRVMSALAEKLNFKLDIKPPPNGELWGENKNGTFTGKRKELENLHTQMSLLKGLVGQLQQRRSDIGFANLFVVPDRMKYIDYTDPYMIEYASFMLSKSF